MRTEHLRENSSSSLSSRARHPPLLQIRTARDGNLRKFIACFVVATVFVAFAPALANAPLERAQVIIVFKETPDADLIMELGGEVIATYRIIPGLAARVPIEALEELRKNPAVAYIEPDAVVYVLGQQVPWGISRIGAPSAWSFSTGAEIKVAILDTGIENNHPDLAANVKGGISFVSADPADWNDGHGHGTHVAGTVAAVNNDVGVVGSAPDAWLYGVKVLSDSGEGYVSDVIEGIDWSVQNGMQVLNMSLGTASDVSSFEDACDQAYEAGLLLVAAAGNKDEDDPPYLCYPAAYDSVIAVAATDSNDQAPSWSNSGPFVELAAPGVSILSTYKGSTYATLSGTSMAAPHVSGTTALVWERNPGLTNVQVRSILQQTAEDLGPAGRDTVYGYGLVRADEAVQTNILTLRPNASGEYTEYTTVFGAAEHWDAVNDVAPDEDNTYIETKTAGHRDTFNLENSALPDVPIYNVRVYARARKTTGAATKINLMVRTYDNDHLSEDMALTSSYVAHSRDWAVNPHTGGSWTVSEVDALQAGVRSASPRNHRVTQVYVDVTYKVPTYGVEVSISPSYQSAPLGTTLEYIVSVINLGDAEDNYNLTVRDNAGWEPTLLDNSLMIPAGENRTTTLSVTIPENAMPNTKDNIIVTATSQGDNTVKDNASCIAHAVMVPPELLTPSDGTLTDNNTPTFRWENTYVADNYEIWVDNDPDFLSPVSGFPDNTTENFYVIEAPGLADENYSWKVRAYKGAGVSDFSGVLTFIVDTTPPAKPTLAWPVDGENISDNTPNLDWEDVEENTLPVLYQVFISDNSEFPYENRTSPWVENDNWIVSPALPEGVWYWRVRARDNVGNVGENSDARSFRVDVTAPSAPTLLEPVDGTTISVNTPTFRWTAVTVENSLPVTYDIQIDNDNNFASPENSATGLIDNTYTPSALADENYSWRVRAVDNAGNASAWSSVWTLLIKTIVRGVNVSISPSENSGLPAENLTYAVTVTNVGALADNYNLTVSDNENWNPTLSHNLLVNVQPSENRIVTLSVTIPENAIGCAEDNIIVIATSMADNTMSDNDSCIAHAVSPKAEFSLVTLYKISLDVNLYLENGSKLVVKFYTYMGDNQGENLVWENVTPAHVVLLENIPHPQGKAVERAELVLTDAEGATISTLSTFVVGRRALIDRIFDISMEYPSATSAQMQALMDEIFDISMIYPSAPP